MGKKVQALWRGFSERARQGPDLGSVHVFSMTSSPASEDAWVGRLEEVSARNDDGEPNERVVRHHNKPQCILFIHLFIYLLCIIYLFFSFSTALHPEGAEWDV